MTSFVRNTHSGRKLRCTKTGTVQSYLFSRTVPTTPPTKTILHELAQSTEGSIYDGLPSSATCGTAKDSQVKAGNLRLAFCTSASLAPVKTCNSYLSGN